MTDHQALEPLIKPNRSNKTYSARLTRWLDRLAHFTINVNHIAGKHLALTDYLSRNPLAPAQRDDAYEEEYVINSIASHYGFASKFGCLSNHFNQSQSKNKRTKLSKANKYRSTDNTREQNAISSRDRTTKSDVEFKSKSNLITMDAKTIDSLEKINSSKRTTDLIERWRNIVKPGVYRLSNGKLKKYLEQKFLRGEKRTIEETLSEIIRRQDSPVVEISNRPIQNQHHTKYITDWQFTEARNNEGVFIPQENNRPSTFQACPTTSYSPDETPMEDQPLTGPNILN